MEVMFSAQWPWWNPEPHWEVDQVSSYSSPPSSADSEAPRPIWACLQSLSSPKRTTIIFSSPLQPPFLWGWFLLITGLMKAIITEVWMTNALATFHRVFVNSNPPSNAKMNSGGASSESSCLLDYSKKPLPPKLISQPHNHHPTPFTSQFWL